MLEGVTHGEVASSGAVPVVGVIGVVLASWIAAPCAVSPDLTLNP